MKPLKKAKDQPKKPMLDSCGRQIISAVDGSKHPLYKTKLCFDFMRDGKCPRKNHCYFAHSVDELRRPSLAEPKGKSMAVKDDSFEVGS